MKADFKPFGQAFAEARERGLLEFRWRGMLYHTRQADETPEEWEEAMLRKRKAIEHERSRSMEVHQESRACT